MAQVVTTGESLVTERAKLTLPAHAPERPLEDLKQFQQLYSRLAGMVDRNQDGKLSLAEVDSAISDVRFNSVPGAKLVHALKTNFERLATVGGDPEAREITAAGVKRLTALAVDPAHESEMKPLLAGLSHSARTVEAQVSGSKELFGKVNLERLASSSVGWLESINPKAISQGDAPDCYFLSVLGSLAGANASERLGLIQSITPLAGESKFQVRFPGDKNNPVVVERPTLTELSLYNGSSEYGIWAAVVEKAFTTRERSLLSRTISGDTPAQEALSARGGDSSKVIELLTGKSSDRIYLETPIFQLRMNRTEELHNILSEFVSGKHQIATAGVMWKENGQTDMGLTAMHEYSIIGYDRASRTVRLRNPIQGMEPVGKDGKAFDGVIDGEFSLSLDTFQKQFSVLTYQKGS